MCLPCIIVSENGLRDEQSCSVFHRVEASLAEEVLLFLSIFEVFGGCLNYDLWDGLDGLDFDLLGGLGWLFIIRN